MVTKMLFEYHELSIYANIRLSTCNIGSFFALIKLQYWSFSSMLTTEVYQEYILSSFPLNYPTSIWSKIV